VADVCKSSYLWNSYFFFEASAALYADLHFNFNTAHFFWFRSTCVLLKMFFFFSIIKHVCMNKLIKGQQKLMILFLKELCNINFNLTFSFTIPKWSTKNKKKWFPSNLSLLSFNYFFFRLEFFFHFRCISSDYYNKKQYKMMTKKTKICVFFF